MMQVLGIDPSLRCTGYALTGPSGVVFPNRIPTGAVPDSLQTTAATVRYIVGHILRHAPAGDLLTVIESPYIPKHGAGAVLERAWLFGFLVDQLLLRGPVVRVTPAQRAKYGASNGNADKKAVKAAVREAFPGLAVRDDNEADAIVLASMGARHLGFPIDGDIDKKQREAMAAVVWPVIEKREQ